MRTLKLLVGVMTILIVLGMALIAYGLYHKANDPDFSFFSGPGRGVFDTGRRPPFAASIALSSGCSIVEVRPDGNRVYVRVGPNLGIGPLDATCERIIVLDAATGAEVGTIGVGR